MIPLLHDFDGTTVLVFGGGPTGARKARRFAREATVYVVSPSFTDGTFGDSELIRAAPTSDTVADWIDRVDPALTVAATNDTNVNAAIEQTTQDRNILCNRADQSGTRPPGSVVVPATVRDEPVVIAVGTNGTAPAVSRHLRKRLEDDLSGIGAVADTVGTLREQLPAETNRSAVFRRVLADQTLWETIENDHDDPDRVVRRIFDRIVDNQQSAMTHQQ